MIISDSYSSFRIKVDENPAVLAYFSHEQCSVCKTMKPKLLESFQQQFPKIEQVYIDIEQTPELAAQFSVFTAPTILIFFEGKETFRKSRNIGIEELTKLVKRPYSILFD